MKTPRHQLAAVLANQSLAPKLDLRAYSRTIAAYLLENSRSGELDSLLRDIIRIRAEHGIVEVVAVSAFPLDAAARSDIKREALKLYPKAKQIVISQQHDPDVVAGVRLEFPNEQLDLTVRDKLNRFKQLTIAGD